MAREPSIHVKQSDLEKILKRLSIQDAEALSHSIVSLAKGYSVVTRTVTIATEYAEKKIIKQNVSDASTVMQFYTIYSLLVKQKHKFTPKRLKVKDTTLMSIVSQIMVDAMDFSETFKLDYQEGYRKYLEIGLRNSPKIRSLIGKIEVIQDIYKADMEIGNGSAKAEVLFKHYQEAMMSYTGTEYNVRSSVNMAKFKRAADWCYENNIEPKDFIQGLFKGLEWKQGIPSPNMFTSDYGIQLVYEYLGSKPTDKADGFVSINLKSIVK